MGLLKRFRASSSASTRPSVDNFDDLPPPPLPHAHSQTQLSASVSRASVAESSIGSTTQSTKFWKRKDKSKGKEREIVGIPYESTPLAPSPSARSASYSFHHVPSPSARSTGSGYHPSYAQTHFTPTPLQHHHPPYDHGHAARTDREGSATPTTSPRQETTPKAKGLSKPQAMLGRLDFEQSPSYAEPLGQAEHTSLVSEVEFAGTAAERHSLYLPQQMATRPSQPYGRPQTMILADVKEGNGRSSQEEVMEHLVSPEKRGTWTPQSGVEARGDEPGDQGSPTPRKSALPPQPLVPAAAQPSDEHNAPSTRRPSASRRSSFIPLGNPFRRASVVSDLDAQVIDDGSFQITGFRHVSGASEADHGLDPYHSHPSRAEIKEKSDAIQPPPRPASTAPAAASIQRPVSRATSLASIDDHITSTAKVSAAAFRRGIRRASSNYLDAEANDDEDDVPLGLLRPGGRSSSALSLSSMREGGSARLSKSPAVPGPMRLASKSDISQLSQPASPLRMRKSPSLGPAVGTDDQARSHSHARTKTMPLISPDEIHPVFSSPSNSPVSSPKRDTAPLSVATGSDYFAPKALAGVRVASAPRTPPVVVDSNVTTSPGFDFDTLDYPVSAFSTSPEISKVDAKPSQVVTKPAILSGVKAPLSTENTSAGAGAARAPAHREVERDDVLDEDLVLRSMALYGDANVAGQVNLGIENEPPTPKLASRQQSQSALSPTESETNVRSPLSERLGNLVLHGPEPMASKPSLQKLNTLKLDNGAIQERLKSPASDSTISPITREQQTPTLASSFDRINGSRGTEAPAGSLSDSEATDSSEEESDARPTLSVGPPRSSFANASRPTSNHKSASSQSSISRPIASDDDGSDDDEPLARIKSKASRSSLAVDRDISNTPNMRPATIHSSSPNAKPSTKTIDASVSPPIPSNVYSRRSSVPSASVVPTPPTTAYMQGKVWDASPASSQSGLTGDSLNQPITPSDQDIANGRGLRDASDMWSDNGLPKDSAYLAGGRERRGSHTSAATAPAGHGHFDTSSAPPMPLNAGDTMARQRMKEIWQAQYMAAASRAFEDEWERQSNASVASPSVAPSVAQTNYSPAPQAIPHPYHQYAMPPPMSMMPMAYGYPPAQAYMYPQHYMPQQYPLPHQPESSMYAYGPGAQSVYGAEFGPPTAQIPYSPHRPMSMVFPQSYSASNLSQYSSPSAPAHRPALQTSQSSYFTQGQQRPAHGRGGSEEFTPPKGLVHQIPNSPSRPGNGHHHRRSQLGTSVFNANDRDPNSPGAAPPPTSWRRSTAPLGKPVQEREREEATEAPRRKRQSSYLVN